MWVIVLPGGPFGPLCPLIPVPGDPLSPFSPGKPTEARVEITLTPIKQVYLEKSTNLKGA